MKKLITFFMICAILFSFVITVCAEEGRVIYSGDAGEFIFEPGSLRSLTDLFPNFKSVMPGDTLKQKITLKNDASQKVKVKIYMRSLGTHEESLSFLSELGLKIRKSSDNSMEYMFDSVASETFGLSDWVYLGTLYSGAEVNIDVILTVPCELGNDYQEVTGYLDWEFKVEEFPIEPDDPKPPIIGNNSHSKISLAVMASSLVIMILLFISIKKDEKKTSKK